MTELSPSEKIKNGEFVVVQRGDYQRVILFQEEQTIIFGKGHMQQDIQLRNVVGQPYYSAFRIIPLPLDQYPPPEPEIESNYKKGQNVGRQGRGKGGKKPQKKLYYLEKVTQSAAKSFSQLTFETETSLPKGKDNRNLLDDKTSQPLGHSDIHSLKDAGLSSQEILTTIISSSKSFAQKTEFSQEKYLKKKEKVHGDLLLFFRPDLSLVADYFFKKDPIKVLGLRVDTLSQILSYANVHANGRYLVYENANGLLVGGMLVRMGGFGELLHCHVGTNPQRQAMTYLNLGEDLRKPLRDLDVVYLIEGRKLTSGSSSMNGNKARLAEALNDESPLCKKAKLEPEGDEEMQIEDDGDVKPNSNAKPISSYREQNEKSLEMLNTPFHGLVICGKEHPLSIFQRLLPHLFLSSPFVVYSPYPEPLMECYNWVKEKGVGANLHIVDNWMRNIQVDTDRTHPENNMSSSGGYIFYGILVGEKKSECCICIYSKIITQSSPMDTVHNLCCESSLRQKYPKVKFPNDLTVNSTYLNGIALVAGLLQRRNDLIYQKTGNEHEFIYWSNNPVPTLDEVNYYIHKLGEALPELYHKHIHFNIIWHPNKHVSLIKRILTGFAKRILKIKESLPTLATKQKRLLNLKNKGLKASTLTLGREIENGRETKSFIENMRGHADAVKNERNNFKEKIEKIDLEMKNGLFEDIDKALIHYKDSKARLNELETTQILNN